MAKKITLEFTPEQIDLIIDGLESNLEFFRESKDEGAKEWLDKHINLLNYITARAK